MICRSFTPTTLVEWLALFSAIALFPPTMIRASSIPVASKVPHKEETVILGQWVFSGQTRARVSQVGFWAGQYWHSPSTSWSKRSCLQDFADEAYASKTNASIVRHSLVATSPFSPTTPPLLLINYFTMLSGLRLPPSLKLHATSLKLCLRREFTRWI